MGTGAGRTIKTKDALVLAATLALAAAGLAWAWSNAATQTVFLVNGFDVPVRVEVDGHPTELGPNQHAERTLGRGVHHLRATSGTGTVLDDGLVDIPSGATLVVYNVAGAAPLYADSVVYGTGRSGPAPGFVLYGGQRLIVRPRPDFVFVPPPKSISVSSSAPGTVHIRWRFDVSSGGWQTTLEQLAEKGAYREALGLCLDAARTRPDDERAVDAIASLLVRLRGTDAAVAYLEAALERRPDAFTLHRAYQHFLRLAGRFDDARARYRAYRDLHPDSPLGPVLLARVEAREAAVPLYRTALDRHPEDPLARRGLARALLDTGHAAESASRFAEVEKSDPEYQYYVDDHVRALLLLGRKEEALQAAAHACDKFPTEWRLAVLYAQLASVPVLAVKPPSTYVDRLAKRNGDPSFGLWMRSVADLPVDEKELRKLPDGPVRSAISIQVAAGRDPAVAWLLCAKARPGTFARLAAPVALLLASEFERAGDEPLSTALFAAVQEIPFPVSVFKDYVQDGREHPEMWRLDADARAVLDFVRARKLQGEGAAAAPVYAAARTRDPLPSLAARAEAAWPPPRLTRPLAATVVVRRRKA